MPKRGTALPARLDFWTTAVQRAQVVAIAYQTGQAGEHAGACRMLLTKGIQAYMAGLSERERAEYDKIMARVRVLEGIDEVE